MAEDGLGWINRTRRFLRLPSGERILILRALAAVAWAEALIRLLPFGATVAVLDKWSSLTSAQPFDSGVASAIPHLRSWFDKLTTSGEKTARPEPVEGRVGVGRAGINIDAPNRGLRRAIEKADRVVPGRRSCLRRAVAGFLLLGKEPGVSLMVGAKPSKGHLSGHAWLVRGSRDVFSPEGHRRGQAVLTISSQGEVRAGASA